MQKWLGEKGNLSEEVGPRKTVPLKEFSPTGIRMTHRAKVAWHKE
jgi:hypothetical protein